MLWFFLSLLLVLLLLLLLPLEVEIDTERDLYRARWLGIASVWVEPTEGKWRWFYRVLFWENTWQPTKPKPTTKKKKPTKKGKSHLSFARFISLMKAMLHAIKLRRLRVDLDTGDFIRNAQLYPLCFALSGNGRRFNINFMGRQELDILLQTRLWNIAGAFLRTFLSPKIFH